MTPYSVRGAAERRDKEEIHQPELHGAATPMPLPPEPEQPAPILPLANPEPKHPNAEPETPLHITPTPQPPNASRWHGLFFLSGESAEEFNEFYERLDDHYMPYNEEERVCVAKLAEARWAAHRRKRVVESIEAQLYAASPNTANWTEADFKRLAVADAYRLRAERIVRRAQANVDAFVKFRGEDSKWQAYFDLADRRLQLQRQNLAFAMREMAAEDAKQAAA